VEQLFSQKFEDILSMLIRLIYLSRPAGPQTAALTDSILRKAHDWNTQNDITGMLCEGQGLYLQALEGERSRVTRLYARIHADPRHKDLELLHCESIAERRYAGWSMAFVSLSDVDPETKIVWPEFDPYSMNGTIVMRRIDELVARGSPVQISSD
jgi:Sensors of blue-light using FAD